MTDEELGLYVAQHAPADTASQPFAVLYDRYAAISERFIAARVNVNHVADLHQETWVSAWKSPSSFTGGSYRSWLLTIASRKVIDQYRKSGRQTDVAISEKHDFPSDYVMPVERMLEQEDMQRLSNCLDALAPTAAKVVRGRLSGDNYKDLCSELQLTEPAAHKALHKAKAQLQDCLDGKST